MIDAFESLVDAIEPLIDAVESLIDTIFEAVEVVIDAGQIGTANQLGPIVGHHRFEYGIGGFWLQVVGDEQRTERFAGFGAERHGFSRRLSVVTAANPVARLTATVPRQCDGVGSSGGHTLRRRPTTRSALAGAAL